MFLPRKFSTLAALLLALPALRATAAVEVIVPWEKSWPVVSPATAADFGFVLKNSGEKTAKGAFKVRLVSPSGEEQVVSEPFDLPTGGERKIAWPLAGREMGSWTMDYHLTVEGDASAERKRKITFGYLDPVGPSTSKPDFLFGVVSHTERITRSERERELEAAAYVGSKVMRTGSEWGHVQPARDEWKWETMDHLVSKAGELGMEIQVLLAFTTQWAAPIEKQRSKDWLDWSRCAPDREAWRKYVATYAERYKGKIHLWEVWNEPDLEGFWRGTTEEYLEIFQIAREELKKADPANVVMSGGFATLSDHPSRKKNPDLQERVMEAASTRMDLHAVHEHGSFERFAKVVDEDYARLRAALPQPAPPIFFNETAEHSLHGKEKEQAAILVKKAVFARARGAVGYLWYDLRNDGVNPGDPEHHFGLLTHAMEPKPAYIAFNTLAREVVSRPYLRQVEAGTNRWFFLHGDDRKKLLVFWNEDMSAQNEQILLRLPGATEARLMDINGNATALPISGDLVVVNSSKEPQLLLADSAETIEVAGRLAGPGRSFFGGPGEEIEVSCEFSNPSDKPAVVRAEWALPATVTMLKHAPAGVTIPPGGRALSKIAVRLPEQGDYLFGKSGKLKVTYAFSDLPYTGSLLVPIHYGTIDVPHDAAGRAPDVVLDEREQLTSFIEADPHLTAYRWKGPEDLSAKVWLAADAENLILKVAVTDNQHFQPGPAPDMWMADSVQCVLALPGQKGSWELGIADPAEGAPLVAVWAVPAGKEDCRSAIRADIERQGEGRVYTLRIPRAAIGLEDGMLREGFRLNLAINDNDGKVRAHALQIAPGIVASKSTDAAPFVRFQENPPSPQ